MDASADDAQDLAWVRQVQRSDDRAAFASLLRRHQSGVRGLLRRLTQGDTALADELAQECFLNAYRAMVGFRGEARIKTWLYRIAYNGFLQQRRRLAARPVTQALDDELRDEHLSAPGQMAHDIALRLDVQKALRVLSGPERDAIVCCCQADLSHAEAAELLGWPLGTVKTHVLRAKAKLRVALAAWAPVAAADKEHAA